jgi:hypothetical protein
MRFGEGVVLHKTILIKILERFNAKYSLLLMVLLRTSLRMLIRSTVKNR